MERKYIIKNDELEIGKNGYLTHNEDNDMAGEKMGLCKQKTDILG